MAGPATATIQTATTRELLCKVCGVREPAEHQQRELSNAHCIFPLTFEAFHVFSSLSRPDPVGGGIHRA